MILKLRIGHKRITFTFAQVVDVLGVNSKLSDGKHILMWDFDKHTLDFVSKSLRVIQRFFNLPRIYILRSSHPDNYIAYCFTRCEWPEARSIVGMTVGIDENYFKWAVFRRRFTLRVGEKLGIKPQCVRVLDSPYKEEVALAELKSWVRYETLDGHHDQTVHFVELP